MFNLGPITTKIVSLLYLQPNEVAMEDISKKTGYSLASISNKMKFLENAGMVERVKKPGSKKVFFYMEKNILKININKFEKIIINYIEPAKNSLPELISKYKKKAKTNIDKEKLKIIEDYYNQLIEFEKLINKWRKDLENLK